MGTPSATSNKISKLSLIYACFVVYIHCKPEGEIGSFTWWFCTFFNRGICTLAVPFFFTVSGFFLTKHAYDNNWWKCEISKRVKTLLIPYFLWSILYFLYALPLILIANILASESLTRNLPINISDFYIYLRLNPFKYPYLIPLWFIRCLFLFVCVSPIIIWILKKGKHISLLFLLLLFPLGMIRDIFKPEEGEVLWCIVGTFSFLNIFYFVLGCYLCLYTHVKRYHKNLIHLSGLIWVILLFLMTLSTLYRWNLSFYLNYVSIPIGLYFIWHIINSKPWRINLTQASFPIFILHMFFLSMIGLILKQCFPSVIDSLEICLFSSILAFYCSILFSNLAHHYFPKITSFLFGGR